MTRTALAISPHLDDAAFSCGGTLATLAEAGWRVTVATVFTGSVDRPEGFALACQLDKGLGPEVDYMALRRDEDRAACRALGVDEPIWMPFLEAPHRGYETAAALFAELGRNDDHAPIGRALERLLVERRPDLILAPQAVGGHVDHVQVVRALHAAAPDGAILWWTDFPYSVRAETPRRPFNDVMQRLRCVEIDLPAAALWRKREACLAYQSQIGFQFGGRAGLAERLARSGPAEVFRGAGAVPDELFSASRRAAPAPHAAGWSGAGR